MNNLKNFYAEAKKNEELKAALVAANKEMEGITDQKAIQNKVMELARKFGFELTEDDFLEKEGELDLDDLEAVAGGSGRCFISNVGCEIFGQMEPSNGGCVFVGTWY